MKVQFEDSFFASLKQLIWHNSRLYKLYTLIRYDIWYFFSNIWKFRKVLWNHRWWDYHYHMEAMYTSLSIMEKGMHAGLEIRETRDKKIQKMQRALELLKNKIDDNYIERVESVLGEMVYHDWEFGPVEGNLNLRMLLDKDTAEEKLHKTKVYDCVQSLEDAEWSELWEIYKGQDVSELNTKFDGSGLESWWD